MNTPEYTITNQALKNIANIEYAKAIIETTTILPHWQNQLKTEAQARSITYSLQNESINTSVSDIKKYLNDMPVKISTNIIKLKRAQKKVEDLAKTYEFDENDIKDIYKILTQKTTFRSKKIKGTTDPEEILAQITQLIDWYSSLDAKETHPIVVTAIFRAKLEHIKPFEEKNSQTTDLLTTLCLKSNKYSIKDFYSLEEGLYKNQREYLRLLADAKTDYTKWIEFFTDVFSRELLNIAENIKILAKDTKIAKAAGASARLSQRQERIITYLQDYGFMKNKDFARLFPSISEDTVLRELKSLVQKGIIVKRGKTKSSFYELS